MRPKNETTFNIFKIVVVATLAEVYVTNCVEMRAFLVSLCKVPSAAIIFLILQPVGNQKSTF